LEKDSQKINILVVEDNIGDFVLIEEYLEENILLPTITHATSFKEASKLLTEKNLFHIILLDLSLPDKSGEELISGMMNLCNTIPVIILTGYADISFSRKSLKLGASDYLLKDELNSFTLYKSVIYNIERKRIFAELEESEKRYNDLFHLSPQPMWLYHIDTLKFIDVNDAAVKHYGYSKQEFLSMTIKDIRPEEDIPVLMNAISKLKFKDSLFFSGVYRHKKKNDEIINVEIYSNIIQIKGDDVKIVLANDITDRLHYIKAIEEQNIKLKEIAWEQSHIIRAPLARLMGLTHLIKKKDTMDDDAQKTYDLLQDAAKEIDDTIKRITQNIS
jgi:PAS domain S-box-containing protein